MTVLPERVVDQIQVSQDQLELLDYLKEITVELAIMADIGGFSQIGQAYREALTEIKAIR